MQVGAYINLVCDADEQKAVNLARTGAGLVSHFAGMKAASTDHLPPQIKDIAENLKTQYDMAHHAQEKGSHLGMIDDEFVRWMAICGTPYEGPPGKRITGIVDVAELFATDVMPQIRKDYGAS